jgi:hypothetical protein
MCGDSTKMSTKARRRVKRKSSKITPLVFSIYGLRMKKKCYNLSGIYEDESLVGFSTKNYDSYITKGSRLINLNIINLL